MITPAQIEASLRQPLAARALPLAPTSQFVVPALAGRKAAESSSAQLPPSTFATPTVDRKGGTTNKAVAHALGQGPHLVCTSLEDLQAFTPPESILTDFEKTRAAAFKVAHARESFILGRLAAKLAVGALVGEREWTRIGVSNGVLGQPVVDAAEVSLSHVEGFAAAVAFPRGCLMGIDLELIDDGRAATVRDEVPLHPAEQAWLQSGQAPEPAARILLWTAREALGKVLRSGLGTPLELLGLRELRPAGVPGVFLGHYQNFPACHCVSWLLPGRVLTIALTMSPAWE